MRLRSVVLALALASGLASAADKPKPPKVQKHAVKKSKAAKHANRVAKGVVRKNAKVARQKVSAPKIAKHKTSKFNKRKA